MRRVGTSRSGLVFELGGGLLVDTAGNNTVTNSGTTLTADHNGRANRGLQMLAASSQRIQYPNSLIRNKQKFSIEVSFLNTVGVPNALFAQYTMLANYLGLIKTVGNNMAFLFSPANSANFGTINQAKWYHVVFAYDGTQPTNATKYTALVDGVQQSSNASGTLPSATFDNDIPLYSGFLNTTYYDTTLDLLKIYDRTLSITEMQKLYNHWRSH